MPFRKYNQDQTKIICMNYREMLDDNHDAVVISMIIDYLDTTEFEERYGKVGNPAYSPKLMLKVLLYGYSKGLYGGRPIFNNCPTDLGFRFITNDDFPGYSAINEFRVNFKDEIAGIFAKVVLLCKDLGLIGFENLAIDSQKLKANANLFQNKNHKGVRRELERIRKKIVQILDTDVQSEADEIECRRKISSFERRKKKLKDAMIVLESLGGQDDKDVRYNITDPDSKVMTDKTGAKHPDYLIQNAVDDYVQVLTAVEATNIPTDVGQLQPMKEASKKNTGRAHKNTEADAGYSFKEEYPRMAADPDTEYFVPDRTKESSKKDPYSKWKFEYIPEHDVYLCPNNQLVYLARIIEEDGREILVYETENCSGCPYQKHCLKKSKKSGDISPSHNRTITIYPEDELIKEMRAKLDSDEGKKIYQHRMVTVEPVHGDMQKNRGFLQFVLRGLEKVKVEYNLLGIAHNIRKIRLHALDALRLLVKSDQKCIGSPC